MKKIEFKNLPSKETPLSASNLNLLQQNVEDEFSEIQNNVKKKFDTMSSFFTIPQGEAKKRYIKIAEFKTNIGNDLNCMQVKIYGTIKYGSNRPGFDILEASTRGGMRISVLSFNYTSETDNQRYGYVNRIDGMTELWIEQNFYAYKSKVEVTNVINCNVGLLKMQETIPAGFKKIERNIIASEKSLISVYKNTEQIEQMGDNVGKGALFDTVQKKTGDAFELNGNRVVIKKDCFIKVSYNFFCEHIGGYIQAEVYRRRPGSSATVINSTINHIEGMFKCLGASGFVAEVKANDDIVIDLKKTAPDRLKIRGGFINNYLTIEEI